jgi:hypothetical protein
MIELGNHVFDLIVHNERRMHFLGYSGLKEALGRSSYDMPKVGKPLKRTDIP